MPMRIGKGSSPLEVVSVDGHNMHVQMHPRKNNLHVHIYRIVFKGLNVVEQYRAQVRLQIFHSVAHAVQ